MRTSTSPSTSSAISASRTDGRETPSCFARSRSGGRRAPAENSPRPDEAADLVGDLPVEAAGLDALERHGGWRARQPTAATGRIGGRLTRGGEVVKWYYQFRRGAYNRGRPQPRPRTLSPSAHPHARHHDRPRSAPRPSPCRSKRRCGTATARTGGGSCARSSRSRPPTATSASARWAAAARTRRARSRASRATCVGHDVFALEAMRLKVCNPDREPLQQPHAAARGDRVRVPRHHRPEARRAGPRAPRRQAARRGRVRELPVLPLPRSGDRRGRGAHGRPAGRAREGAEGAARLHVAQAQGRRVPARRTSSRATARSRSAARRRHALRPQRRAVVRRCRALRPRRSRTCATTGSRTRCSASRR